MFKIIFKCLKIIEWNDVFIIIKRRIDLPYVTQNKNIGSKEDIN